MRSISTIFLFVLLFFTACKKQDTPFVGLYHSYKMFYGPDTTLQVMDIYVPAHTAYKYVPVMILIHGGGWFAGSTGDFDATLIYDTLVNQGYAVVNMNYRLAPAAKYPAQLDDIDSVIVFLQKNQQKLQIDPTRICLLGRSSGGHLALQYAYTRNHSNNIKAVIDCFGIPDLVATDEMAVRLDTQIANFLGAAYIDNKPLWRNASPINHMDGSIPTIIFQGTIDDVVFPVQSETLKDSLDARGTPYKYVEYIGWGHGFDPPLWQRSMGVAGAWLHDYVF